MNWIHEYIVNAKKVLHCYNNPLKDIENLNEKDRLEKEIPYLAFDFVNFDFHGFR